MEPVLHPAKNEGEDNMDGKYYFLARPSLWSIAFIRIHYCFTTLHIFALRHPRRKPERVYKLFYMEPKKAFVQQP